MNYHVNQALNVSLHDIGAVFCLQAAARRGALRRVEKMDW